MENPQLKPIFTQLIFIGFLLIQRAYSFDLSAVHSFQHDPTVDRFFLTRPGQLCQLGSSDFEQCVNLHPDCIFSVLSIGNTAIGVACQLSSGEVHLSEYERSNNMNLLREQTISQSGKQLNMRHASYNGDAFYWSGDNNDGVAFAYNWDTLHFQRTVSGPWQGSQIQSFRLDSSVVIGPLWIRFDRNLMSKSVLVCSLGFVSEVDFGRPPARLIYQSGSDYLGISGANSQLVFGNIRATCSPFSASQSSWAFPMALTAQEQFMDALRINSTHFVIVIHNNTIGSIDLKIHSFSSPHTSLQVFSFKCGSYCGSTRLSPEIQLDHLYVVSYLIESPNIGELLPAGFHILDLDLSIQKFQLPLRQNVESKSSVHSSHATTTRSAIQPNNNTPLATRSVIKPNEDTPLNLLDPTAYWFWIACGGIIVFGALLVVTSLHLRRRYLKNRAGKQMTDFDRSSILTSSQLSTHSHISFSTQKMASNINTAYSLKSDATTMHMKTAIETYTLVTKQKELSIPGYLQLTQNIDFQVKEKIGAGGFAGIFLCALKTAGPKRLNNDKEQCVIKLLPIPKLSEIPNSLITDQESGFFQEIAIMNFFRGNPHFVQILGFSLDPCAIIMKHYLLGSLRDFIATDQRKNMSTRQLLEMSVDLFEGLDHMHTAGFVHCDLKSQNIFIDIENNRFRPVLADLGIARVVNPSSMVQAFPKSKLVGWSLPFCPPEVLASVLNIQNSNLKSINFNREISGRALERADIYSMAVVLFELVYAKPAWQNFSEAVAKEIVLYSKRPEVSEPSPPSGDVHIKALGKLIEKCWNQEAQQRPTAAMAVQFLWPFLK